MLTSSSIPQNKLPAFCLTSYILRTLNEHNGQWKTICTLEVEQSRTFRLKLAWRSLLPNKWLRTRTIFLMTCSENLRSVERKANKGLKKAKHTTPGCPRMKLKWARRSCIVLMLLSLLFILTFKQLKDNKERSERTGYTDQDRTACSSTVVVLTISLSFTYVVKESPLQKADQDKVGRLVVMKMSNQPGHLLWGALFVYKTLQRNRSVT